MRLSSCYFLCIDHSNLDKSLLIQNLHMINTFWLYTIQFCASEKLHISTHIYILAMACVYIKNQYLLLYDPRNTHYFLEILKKESEDLRSFLFKVV